MYTSFDDFVMANLVTYNGKELKAIESAKIDLPTQTDDLARMDTNSLQSLLKWMKEVSKPGPRFYNSSKHAHSLRTLHILWHSSPHII